MDQTRKRLTAKDLYRYLPTINDRVAIENLRGETVVFTKAQLEQLLQTPDLHHHFKEMYETALERITS